MEEPKFIIDVIPLIVVSVFILLDIVSGVVKAASQRALSSSIMRKGLWHKMGTIMLELLAAGASIAILYWGVLPTEFAAVYQTVSVYIVLMEVVSILENISEINPELKLIKLFDMFGVNKETEETVNK